LICAYNSLCCYPLNYSWKKDLKTLILKPQSSIFIKACQKGSIKHFKGFYKRLSMRFNKKILRFSKRFNKILRYVPFFDEESSGKLLNEKTDKDYQYYIYLNEEDDLDLDRRKEFFNNLNGEAIIDFKWRTFGKYYYFLIWLMFTAFYICFIIGSLPTTFDTNEIQYQLFVTTITFGLIQLCFELRQFIWDPVEYIYSIWNWFDLNAYLFPIIASWLWIRNKDLSDVMISLSCLFLNIKFLLFFRAFESFGVYFAIIFGVIRRVSSFMIILVLFIGSFALSFHILLKPKDLVNYLTNPDLNDQNNPWALSKKFNQISEDGVINPKSTLIEAPEESTNLFTSFDTSLLATYLFLTGDSSSLTQRAPIAENAIIIILMVLFYNDRASYLVQKAEI